MDSLRNPGAAYAPTDQAVRLFTSANRGARSPQLRNNATLNEAGVKIIADKVFTNTDVKAATESVMPDYLQVLYNVNGGPAIRDGIDFEIQIFKDTATAEDAMKAYLSIFDSDLTFMAKTSDEPLGHVSLQIGTGLMWVRDAMLLRVGASDQQAFLAKVQDPGEEEQGSSGAGGDNTLPSIPQQIQEFASAIDQNIQENAVPDSEQKKVDTTAAQASYNVSVGQMFTIQLASDANTRDLKPALSSDSSVAVPIGYGTSEGYPFMAYQAGKTTVTLIVAHSETLAVETINVEVDVTASQSTGDPWDIGYAGQSLPE